MIQLLANLPAPGASEPRTPGTLSALVAETTEAQSFLANLIDAGAFLVHAPVANRAPVVDMGRSLFAEPSPEPTTVPELTAHPEPREADVPSAGFVIQAMLIAARLSSLEPIAQRAVSDPSVPAPAKATPIEPAKLSPKMEIAARELARYLMISSPLALPEVSAQRTEAAPAFEAIAPEVIPSTDAPSQAVVPTAADVPAIRSTIPASPIAVPATIAPIAMGSSPAPMEITRVPASTSIAQPKSSRGATMRAANPITAIATGDAPPSVFSAEPTPPAPRRGLAGPVVFFGAAEALADPVALETARVWAVEPSHFEVSATNPTRSTAREPQEPTPSVSPESADHAPEPAKDLATFQGEDGTRPEATTNVPKIGVDASSDEPTTEAPQLSPGPVGPAPHFVERAAIPVEPAVVSSNLRQLLAEVDEAYRTRPHHQPLRLQLDREDGSAMRLIITPGPNGRHQMTLLAAMPQVLDELKRALPEINAAVADLPIDIANVELSLDDSQPDGQNNGGSG